MKATCDCDLARPVGCPFKDNFLSLRDRLNVRVWVDGEHYSVEEDGDTKNNTCFKIGHNVKKKTHANLSHFGTRGKTTR